MKTTTFLLLLLSSLVSVLGSGCNTINGAGKDIEKAGDKIQDASRK